MRIAIVSDIHGNLLALDAVMSDLEKQSPDEIWCGGDLAWAGPWGSECIARVREAGWTTVRGNTDVWITGDPQTIDDPDRRAVFEDIARWHAISEDDARWLLSLPIGHSGTGSILLVHGTPESPFRAPQPEAPAAEFSPYESHAGLVVYAHVHKAFVRRLADQTIVCNTGSVGLPMDGPTASYLLIDQNGPDLLLQHRRIEFDRRGAEAQARHLGGPAADEFRQLLAMGDNV
ncbi:MAG TPA: metallophosphoesterase family protein [Actinomycetota bacterium]|nr:metallophosphoesterase family protein [Actinomycetota bacterium]